MADIANIADMVDMADMADMANMADMTDTDFKLFHLLVCNSSNTTSLFSLNYPLVFSIYFYYFTINSALFVISAISECSLEKKILCRRGKMLERAKKSLVMVLHL